MTGTVGVPTRHLAIDAVERINTRGAYANLVLSPMLERSSLDERDRALVTELVYGTVRRRRACDWLVDRFLYDEVEPRVRAALELGAYQLVFMGQPPHAAVSATVGAVPRKVRGLVNAILRRVADDAADGPIAWPDRGTELSYPDWIVELFREELGIDDGEAALARMNEAPQVTSRDDGYIQDLGSQLVVQAIDSQRGDLVLDTCAAPGGKATGMAKAGAVVVAADRRRSRVRLIERNAVRLGHDLSIVAADATMPPFRSASFDKVLVDAPCSGLGTLRRRADARWRIEQEAVERLAELQRAMLFASAPLVKPGGELVYSVCTSSRAETVDVARAVELALPEFVPIARPESWRPWGSGGLLLPHDLDTDGMALFRWRRPT